MLKVENIRELFLQKYLNNEFVIDKSGVKTVEIIGQSFIANEDLIFGERNTDYVERELAWYKSMSLNVNDIPGETPKIWKQVATPEGLINSNYGYLVYSNENYSQFNNVISELVRNPDSRRAIMVYTRPSIWYEYDKDGMSDFICTNAVQYMIRDRKLHAVVSMRSNDAVFGFKNDYAWQQYILKELLAKINISEPSVKLGDIIWCAGSLHVYERHFQYIDKLNTMKKLF